MSNQGISIRTGSAIQPAFSVEREQEHRCGRCANPTGITNPDCPGRRKEQAKGQGDD